MMIKDEYNENRIDLRLGLPHIPTPYNYDMIGAGAGSCVDGKKTVLVLVINAHSLNERLLQASRHVNQMYEGTEGVVFWANEWRASSWNNIRKDFENVDVRLKLFRHPPIKL